MSSIPTDTDYDKLEDDLFPPNSSARSTNTRSTSRSSPKKQSRRHHRNNSASDMSVGSGFRQSKDFRKMIDEENMSKFEDEQERDKEEIYIVKQRYGYLSILFSVAQTIVLITMMSSCGVAPLNINPMVGPYPDALSEWGGKNAINILDDGEWWRLVTPIMLHAGIIHLLCNVAVQLETGAFFEREWGSGPWLIIYLVSGVGSSILSVIIMPDAISVGSSGSVMGLFGGKLAEIVCRYCESDKTEQAKIGHQVRKEQCAGVSCSVLVVLLFSFIPYGKILDFLPYLSMFVSLVAAVISHRIPFCFFDSGLGGTFGRSHCGTLHRYCGIFRQHQDAHLENVLVFGGNGTDDFVLCCYIDTYVFGSNRTCRRTAGCLCLLHGKL
jgi:membrane associated rhomboid family serine protease